MDNEYFYLEEVTKCQDTDNGNANVSWLATYSNGLEAICFTVDFREVTIVPKMHVTDLEKIKMKFL